VSKSKEIERAAEEEIDSTSRKENRDSLPISPPGELRYTEDNNKQKC